MSALSVGSVFPLVLLLLLLMSLALVLLPFQLL